MKLPVANGWAVCKSLLVSTLFSLLIIPFPSFAQDNLVRDTLSEWVRTGKATPVMIDTIFQGVDLQNKKAAFEEAINFVKKEFPDKGETFIKNVVFKTLDKKRFSQVDSLLAQIAEKYDLEAIVRTGSSGQGYLNRPGDYRPFLSDDDISFVGKDASAAAREFNQLLEKAGLQKLKVEGFTIYELKSKYPGYDTIGLEMLDRGKYVGEAALKQIKSEMYDKGAVIYQKPGNKLIKMPQPLSSFVATNQKKILQEYIGEAFEGPIQKYGALTAVASTERQIGGKGWEKLEEAEKIKYVKRQFKALRESRGLADIGGMDEVAITQREEYLDFLLFKVSRGDKLTFEEGVRLISLRSQHINLALKEIPQKMEPLIEAARTSGRSLSGNPEIRKAVQEMATGFALLKQSGVSVSLNPDRVIAEMLEKYPKGSEIYKILYTAHQQGKDLLEFLAAWEKGTPWNREAQEEFLKMLERLSSREEKLAATKAMEEKVAKSAGKEELSVLQGMREMYENALGGTFLDKMIKSPTGHRLMVGVLAAAGGKYILTSMYESWTKGTVQDDLTGAGLALIDFLPGVMSVKRAVNNGLEAMTVFSFVKDAVYFSPYWPLALAGDLIETSVNIGEAIQLQNYQDGLIDILVYSGKFDENHKFLRLELPGKQVVERQELQKFLFETKATSAYNSNIKNLPYRISDLSAVTNEVYFKYYFTNDPVLNKLTKAYQDQLRFINLRESIGSLKDFEWKKSAQSHFNWLMGYESVCEKSPETWCKMLAILKKNMEDRKARIIPDFMIPHLIMLAEEMHKTIYADDELSVKLLELQKKLQALKGGSLGINLKQVVSEKAETEAEKGDTPQNKDIKRGEYWRAAFEAYQKIYDSTVNMKSKVQAETGYEPLKVLQFPWSGDYQQDQVRAAQSIDGFFSDAKKIRDDIQGLKGAAADPQDSVDKQALDILADVVFRWRFVLDGDNKAGAEDPQTAVFGAKRFPQPEKGSPFYNEYEEALKKVKELYGKKDDFQALLEKGAKIVKEQDFLLLKAGQKGSRFELQFTDESLKKNWEGGAISLSWSASPKGTFSPDAKSLETYFTPYSPQTVTISVRVEKSGQEKVNGLLKVVVPVKVPDDFLRLSLEPASPKAEEKAKAETTIPENFYGKQEFKLHYQWSGTNCQVEDVDQLSTTVTAPKSGEAKVTVELSIEGADGKRSSLTSKQVSFNVDGKPDTKTDGKSGDKSKDDKKDQTATPPVIPIPDSYTKGQIGVGKDTGVKTGADTQTGTTGQTDSGKTDVGKTDTGKTDTGKTDKGQTDTGKTDVGKTDISKTDIGKTDTGKTDTGKTDTAISTKVPACTYQYSEWGDCPRATKKQTRTVIGKEPAGCEERGKPVLEQGCTPPPTEEEKRNGYLSCLCRCYTHWAGHIGVFYAPSGYEDCGGSGPCVGGIGAFGNCDRSFFGGPNDCAKGCYEGAYGKGSYDEKTANKIRKDVNQKFKKPLKLTVNDGKCPITAQLGDIITLTAVVEGGIPPHKFFWSGNGQAKDNTFTFANTREPGPHPISVTVTDDDGGSATVTCSVVVEAMTVKIELLDKENKIPLGESRSFQGTVMSGDKPAKGDFYFLWQPHPEIKFSPFEKTGGNISGTKATFNKLGTFKVWVIAHTYKGKIKTTIGESEQIAIEVEKPELKLAFQPQNPKVGQEVKLTVTEKPKMDDKAISFWWEISGSALNAGPLKNEREYTFRPKDTKPVTVTVHGKARDGGDDLGEDKATITAQAFEVKLSEPQHMGSKPKIWKCDTQLGRAQSCGLVEVTKELAVFNDIFIKAAVTPQPEKTPLKYGWSVKPEGICGLPGTGQELKMNCSQTGSFTITVKVRDSQEVELGTASTQANITISQEELEKGKRHLVNLQADKTTLKTGETANIKAIVQGGKPPFTYQWSAGMEGKGDSAKFTPKKSGPQKISVEVTGKDGQKSSASVDIKVEAAKLEVSLKPTKTSIKMGESLSVKATVKGGEEDFSYKWSEGAEGKGDTAQFAPKKSGTQKISLEVTDGKGQKASAGVDIKVEAPKLEAALKADKTTIKIGETASIKAEVKGGEAPLTYKWKEGVEGKDESARFTPKKSGPQKVSLDITDAGGQKATASVDIKVEAPKLEVTLKTDKAGIKIGETAGIKAEVKGGEPVYKYVWGPGVEGKGESVRFTPKKSGTQKLSVEVEDSAKQKSTASLEVKVEAAKLEVTLTADKASLKAGETARLKAAVKGGSQPYEFTWSSQVEGKGETASFSPKEAGYFKIYVEVRDADKKKGVGNLDVTVQEGKGSTDSKTSGQKDSETKGEVISGKQVIEPDPLKLAPGESGVFRAFEVTKAGKKTELPPSKVSWKIEPYRGATIDRTGKVSVAKSARTGTSIKVTALFEKSQTEGTLEIISAPVSTSATKESGVKEIPKTTKIIQPDPLQLSPGGSGLISLLEKDDQGRITAPAGKLSWKLDSTIKDITIKPQKDGVVVVTATKSATAGTKVKILAGLEKFQISGTIEIVPPSDLSTDKQKERDKEKASKVVKDAAQSSQKATAQEPYNPLADPGLKSQKPSVDISMVGKFKEDFQQGQWAGQDKKTKSSSEGSQQNVQQQPTDYTNTTKKPEDPGSASQTQSSTQTPTDTTKIPTETTKPTTDTKTTDKTKTSTQTATKTGIDVQVVGTAPSGKCLIVEGQLVPVKGYKENIANMTVTLTGPVNKSVTSSAGGVFKFPEIPAGNYIISVKQWNYGMTKQNFTAPSGKSVKIVLKGSCPFLYVWTGQKYEKENDLYPVARLTPQEILAEESPLLAQKEGLFLKTVSLEKIPEKLKKDKSQKDYYLITRKPVPDGEGHYRVRIVEQAGEHSFTDVVRLMVIDHQKDQKVGITREGEPFMYGDLRSLSLFQKPVPLYDRESLEIRLPAEAFQNGIIAVTWQGFLDGKAKASRATSPPPRLSLYRQDPEGKWRNVDWVVPRDEVQQSFFRLKVLGSGWDGEGKIKLTAANCEAEKYHRIDNLAWGRLISDLPRGTYLDLLSAVKSTQEEVLQALQKNDDRYLILGPEESASLIFKGMPLEENRERSFIFFSEGFYIPLPLIRFTSN